jgi:2-oxoglutarate dehydrogenase E2 component (dihydrolipoamide succinyltransferase)
MSEVKLPALGESVTEGTITRWLKKVGDTVAIDEALVEVSTDKVDTEIPSPVAGVLQQILVQEDEVALVGAVLAIIGDGVASSTPVAAAPPVVEAPAPVAAPVAPPVVAAPVIAPVVQAPVAPPVAPVVTPPTLPVFTPQVSTPVAAPVTPAATSSDPSYVTPLVRKLAAESGVNLSSVAGTGVGGRIRREDVLTAASGTSSATAVHTPAPTATPSALRGTVEPMSRLRKVLGERAVASMVSSAQLTTVVEVDVTKIAQLRTKVQAEFTSKTGVKLNFMPFFFLAAAEALRTNPKINAAIDGENIVYHATENISFAVDTERGLLTPVIRDAATLSLGVIAQQIADMAARTRENKLKPDELSGGTFTLTNTGSRGALFDTPVVFLPQSAILGTGVVSKRPVVVTDENGQDSIAIRSMVYLALSYDHRIIDGADASRFLVEVKNRLEDANFQGNFGF